METFDIYKTNFINARLRYMNSKDIFDEQKKIMERNPTPNDQELFSYYIRENREAYFNVTNSADLMGDYIAKCAMARIDDDELTCLITAGNTMDECNETYFNFHFWFMPMPTLERLTESNPVLNDICDQIHFGKVDAFEAKKEIEAEGAKCGEITTISGYGENDIMRPPFDQLVDDIYQLAMIMIERYRNGAK